MNSMNYNHLFYFYVIAKLEGFTAAAKHLRTSQSSLSAQMKVLEGSLKRSLFKKSGRKVELTESGKEIFNHCKRAFEVFDEMFDRLDQKSSSMGSRISIGVSIDIERPYITDALSKISKQYPMGLRPLLNLVSLPSHHLTQLLRMGEIDILLTTSASLDSEIENIAELELPVGLIAHSEVLAQVKDRSLDGVLSKEQTIPFVLPSKMTGLRSEIDRFFIRRKVSPICIFESNIISSVVRAASDGLGLTVLPLVYASREIKSKKLMVLNKRPLWKHRMAILSNRHGIADGQKEFIEKLKNHLQLSLSGFDS